MGLNIYEADNQLEPKILFPWSGKGAFINDVTLVRYQRTRPVKTKFKDGTRWLYWKLWLEYRWEIEKSTFSEDSTLAFSSRVHSSNPGGGENLSSLVFESQSHECRKVASSTQISTRPRATKQGRVKCWCHVPFQRSQHRERSRRRADTKKMRGEIIEYCFYQTLSINKCPSEFDYLYFFRNPEHQFRRQKICHQDGGSHQLQLHLLLQEVADEQVDPGPVHRQSRPVHETEEAGPDGRAADEGTSQRREITKANRTK